MIPRLVEWALLRGVPRGDQVGQILGDMVGNKKVEQLKTLTADKRLSVAYIYFIATLNYS